MSTTLERAISELQEKLQIKLNEAADIKKTINNICSQIGKPQIYADVAAENAVQGQLRIRPDQFVGKPLATAIKEYLKIKGKAATSDEIFRALKGGGLEFSGGKESIKMRNLRISLYKNPDIHYIKGSNTFGLAVNYGINKRKKRSDLEGAAKTEVAQKKEDSGGTKGNKEDL